MPALGLTVIWFPELQQLVPIGNVPDGLQRSRPIGEIEFAKALSDEAARYLRFREDELTFERTLGFEPPSHEPPTIRGI